MDEEFVKKVLGQALEGGEKAPENITDLWDCYKRFLKEHQPEIFFLVEQHEIAMKRHFLFAIDIYNSVPKYLMKTGVPVHTTVMVMYGLEKDLKIELQRLVDEEKKKA